MELLRNDAEQDFRRTCSSDHAWVCLGGKMFACLEEGKKRKWKIWTKKCCTLAWISSILCLVLLLCILSLLSQAQGQGMDGPQRDLNRTLFPDGWLMVEFCVCSRDQLELYPPEREKAKLQYASWGPQGNQLVSQSLPRLSDRCVVLIMHTSHISNNV